MCKIIFFPCNVKSCTSLLYIYINIMYFKWYAHKNGVSRFPELLLLSLSVSFLMTLFQTPAQSGETPAAPESSDARRTGDLLLCDGPVKPPVNKGSKNPRLGPIHLCDRWWWGECCCCEDVPLKTCCKSLSCLNLNLQNNHEQPAEPFSSPMVQSAAQVNNRLNWEWNEQSHGMCTDFHLYVCLLKLLVYGLVQIFHSTCCQRVFIGPPAHYLRLERSAVQKNALVTGMTRWHAEGIVMMPLIEVVLTFFVVLNLLICFRTRLKTYPLECGDLLRRARVAFQAGRTLKESFRLTQLEAVVRMLEEHEGDFVDALGRDLHKVTLRQFSSIYLYI